VNTTCIYLTRAGRSRKKKKPRSKKKREEETRSGVHFIDRTGILATDPRTSKIEHSRSSFPAKEELAGSNQDLIARRTAV
jgi:hypothetical protein